MPTTTTLEGIRHDDRCGGYFCVTDPPCVMARKQIRERRFCPNAAARCCHRAARPLWLSQTAKPIL